MKQNFPIFAVLTLLLAGCSFGGSNTMQVHKRSEASTYCEENGGTLEVVPDSGGERGKCNFDDGSFCEEWAYFHGECSPNRGNGNSVELEDIQEMQNDEALTQEEKEEISELVEEIQEYEESSNLVEDSVYCAQEMKQCEDGSYVSIVGENCEFAPCPGEELTKDAIKEKLKAYKNDGTELSESDIDLMNEIIDTITQM